MTLESQQFKFEFCNVCDDYVETERQYFRKIACSLDSHKSDGE
jgi:hypothetical protein